MILSFSELEKYESQMLISGWGAEGQRKLKAAKVAVVGIAARAHKFQICSQNRGYVFYFSFVL